jgi:hypothetical protein
MNAYYDSQIDHIWTNGPTYQSHFGSTEGYWTNLKPIKLTNQFVWQSNYIDIYIYIYIYIYKNLDLLHAI